MILSQTCVTCNHILTPDEIAIHKRLINRGATKHLCKPCLAAHFNCAESVIDEKIAHYKAIGCTLFETRCNNT